ncbi:XPA-interacting protein [Trypanosoma theileri]|uniref:XPA-interacting protein n=1 Tax=Trypanosoma theileri TaxID=67003 RepID=A0A1X0NUU0_9TRYP|nr:XPA-interacting protein [Trypanosoma theileri]ORC88464.1 XPA-interacting protein [Trypanosoma theileri]
MLCRRIWRCPGAASGAVSSNRDGNYAGSLVQSLSLFTHNFYEKLPFASVSAASGRGMGDFEGALLLATRQYFEEKQPQHRKRENESNEERAAESERTPRECKKDRETETR